MLQSEVSETEQDRSLDCTVIDQRTPLGHERRMLRATLMRLRCPLCSEAVRNEPCSHDSRIFLVHVCVILNIELDLPSLELVLFYQQEQTQISGSCNIFRALVVMAGGGARNQTKMYGMAIIIPKT